MCSSSIPAFNFCFDDDSYVYVFFFIFFYVLFQHPLTFCFDDDSYVYFTFFPANSFFLLRWWLLCICIYVCGTQLLRWRILIQKRPTILIKIDLLLQKRPTPTKETRTDQKRPTILMYAALDCCVEEYSYKRDLLYWWKETYSYKRDPYWSKETYYTDVCGIQLLRRRILLYNWAK